MINKIRKPRKPKKPTKPNKFIVEQKQLKAISTYSGKTYNFEELFSKLPVGVMPNETRFRYRYEYLYIYYPLKTNKPNKMYEKEIKKYNADLKKYHTSLKKYFVDLQKWRERSIKSINSVWEKDLVEMQKHDILDSCVKKEDVAVEA